MNYPVEIVPVALRPHGNADSLSLIPVHGWTYVGKTTEWEKVKRAAYIPPDSVVDASRPEFSFLKTDAKMVKEGTLPVRIKAKKLRGVISFGLLVPVPDDTPLGEDWAEKLGVVHYEPPTEEDKQGKLNLGGETEAGPSLQTGGKYDLENFRRHHGLLKEGEPIILMEKMDGANCRFVWWEGRYHVMSRKEWKKRIPSYDHITIEGLLAKGVAEEKAKDIVERLKSKSPQVNGLWQLLEKTPGLEKFLRDNPGTAVYSEAHGNVQSIKYGFPDGDRLAAFDVYRDNRFVPLDEAFMMLAQANVPFVPLINNQYLEIEPIPYSFDFVCAAAEGPSQAMDAKPGTVREGVVVSPVEERHDSHIGRVKLKCVGGTFLEKYR